MLLYTFRRLISQPQFLSIGGVFSMNSLLFTFWITRLPYVREQLSLSEGELGIALFFLPVGGLTALMLSKSLVQRFGEGKLTLFAGMLYAFLLLFPVVAPSFPLLMIALYFMGVATGTMGVAMNAVVAALERRHKTVIMSMCHGCWSLGGMIGATIGSLIVGLDIPPLVQMPVTFLLFVLVFRFLIWPQLHDVRNEQPLSDRPNQKFSLPPRSVLGIAFVGLCIMIGEGAIADWSAIYLQDVAQAAPWLTGLGYAAFALSMTIGRFHGDMITERLGPLRIIQFGSLIALAGMGLVFIAIPPIVIAGFALMGIGYSSIVPVLFSSSARIAGVSPSRGIASVSGAGYIGFLFGPVLIGLIAEEFGLSLGFMVVAVLLLVSLVVARRAIHVVRASWQE